MTQHIYTEKHQRFLKDTCPPDRFICQDVYGDNACFYRALANQLYYRSRCEKARIIFSKNNRFGKKRLESVLNNENWGYDGKEQTRLAVLLQQAARKYNYKHRDKIVDDIGISVADLVTNTHDFTNMIEFFKGWEPIDIYNDVYKTFAGKDVIIRNDVKTAPLIERWGGASEQWALSKYLKTPIIIYVLQSYNKFKNTIQCGRMRKFKPTKNSRFKVSQIFGNEFIGKAEPLNILFKATRKGGHYLTLYDNE